MPMLGSGVRGQNENPAIAPRVTGKGVFYPIGDGFISVWYKGVVGRGRSSSLLAP